MQARRQRIRVQGAFVSLDDVGHPVGDSIWAGEAYGAVAFDNIALGPVQPRLYRVEEPTFLPPAWALLAPTGNVVADGHTIIPVQLLGLKLGDARPPTHYAAMELDVAETDEEVFFVGGAPRNIYHWLFDDLTRIIFYTRSEVFDPSRPVVLSDTPAPFALEFLQMAGIPEIKLSSLKDKPIVRFRRAYLCSSMTKYVAVHPMAVRILLDVFDRYRRPSAGRRLFISRGDTNSRRLRNEDELIARTGFERVTLSGMTARQQIELFSSAEAIIAPHGAGLAHAVWMHAGKVIELCPFKDGYSGVFPFAATVLGMYESICRICGHGYRSVAAPKTLTDDPARQTTDFSIPWEMLEQALSELELV